MYTYPAHIAQEFADIFEWSIGDDGFLNMRSYCHYRDDFYQLARSNILNGNENAVELTARFERAPYLDDPNEMSFAAGNAEYYCRILGLNTPLWCQDIPPVEYEQQPYFAFPRIIGELNDAIENTPPELLERGFIYDEHNFAIA